MTAHSKLPRPALPLSRGITIPFSSEFGDNVARLRHFWLENQVANKTPDDVVHLSRLGRWEALDRQFPIRLREILAVAAALEEALSPAQLVTTLPLLRDLPLEARNLVGRVVHDAFTTAYSVDEIAVEIRATAARFGLAITEVQDSWDSSGSTRAEEALRTRWITMQARGNELLTLLRALPKGVVLP